MTRRSMFPVRSLSPAVLLVLFATLLTGCERTPTAVETGARNAAVPPPSPGTEDPVPPVTAAGPNSVYFGCDAFRALVEFGGGQTVTAFNGLGIYRSPDAMNLGGGGATTRVYGGRQRVRAMIAYNGDLITAFSSPGIFGISLGGPIYRSPSHTNVGGGGTTYAVYSPGSFGPGVTAMAVYQGSVITAFGTGTIFRSPNGLNLGGGGSTYPVYTGTQRATAMVAYQGEMITAFSGGGIYYSPDGNNLGGGGMTHREYSGAVVRSMIVYGNSVITAFSTGGVYKSPDGHNPAGGGSTVKIFEGTSVRVMFPFNGGIIYALTTGEQYFTPDGNFLNRIALTEPCCGNIVVTATGISDEPSMAEQKAIESWDLQVWSTYGTSYEWSRAKNKRKDCVYIDHLDGGPYYCSLSGVPCP